MSLTYWFPFTKDIKNYGTEDVNIKDESNYSFKDGKVGKAIYLDGKPLKINKNILPTTTYSITMWVKVKTINGQNLLCCRDGIGIGFAIFILKDGHMRLDASIDSTNDEWVTRYIFKENSWVHLSIINNNGNVCYYINGIKMEEKKINSSLAHMGKITTIGASQENGSDIANELYGWLNDVRIYDHCLSDVEIKQLSQGLIVHYNMSNLDLDNNLLRGTAEWEYWLDKANVDINGSVLTMNSSVSYPKYEPVEVTVGKQYVVSVDTKADENFTATDGIIIFDYLDSSKNRVLYYWGAGNYTTKWERKNWIITIPSDNRIKYISLGVRATDGKKVYYKKLKLESGDTPHPWCDNSTFSYEPDKVYDISGFGNDGTATNLTYSTDNKIGLASTVFDGKTSRIVTETGSFKWFQFDELTISTWMKPYNAPNTYAGGIGVSFDGGNLNGNNGRTFSMNNHSGIFCVDGIKDETWVTYSSGYTLPLNEWTFCVATLDKEGYIHFYINGEEIKKVLCNFGTTTYTNAKTLFQVGVDLARWR